MEIEMALKAVLEKIEDVEEPFREHYKEQTGPKGVKEYVLDLEGTVDALPAVKSVKAEAAGLRTKAREFETKYGALKAFEGMNATEVLAQLDRISELEVAAGGKLDQAAIDKIVDSRIKTKLAPVERERDQFKTEATTLKGEIEKFTTRDKMRSLADQVRTAATKERMLPEAVDDAIILAERVMEIGDDGNASVKESGLDVVSWVSDMKTKRPHWWGPSTGTGARGGQGGGHSGPNPWSAEGWNMTKQGEVMRADRKKAEQLATAAGTTIGGKRPVVKK